MFIEQGVHAQNPFWKYILGSVVVILFSLVGQVPFYLAITWTCMRQNLNFPTDEASVMTFLDSNVTLFLMLLSFLIAIVGLYIVVSKMHQQAFKTIMTARPKLDWNRIVFSFTIWAVFTIIVTISDYYLNPSHYVLQFKWMPFLILFFIALVFIPIQTTCEELVFRGYLMQGFANLHPYKWFPLIMTSLLFGSLHLYNPEIQKMGYVLILYYIGTGFLLGIIALMDDGIELSIGFHAANNLITALLVTSDWTVFQTNSIFKDISEPEMSFQIFFPLIVVYPILIYIFSRKYHWNNWKERLFGAIKP